LRPRTRKKCVRPAPRAWARHRAQKRPSIERAHSARSLSVLELDVDASDQLRGLRRAIGIDCADSEDAQQIAPSRAFVPCLYARRVHLLHVAGIGGTSTPRARHEQHTARVALATGRRSATAWAKIAFMYASSAYARSSGSTVEWTLISPRPLCLKPASPRPLARTMFKSARLGAEAPNSSSASTFQTVSSSSGGPSRSAAVASALAPADAAQAKACCRPRDTFLEIPTASFPTVRASKGLSDSIRKKKSPMVVVSFNHNKRSNS
jgi:hypothetical protein